MGPSLSRCASSGATMCGASAPSPQLPKMCGASAPNAAGAVSASALDAVTSVRNLSTPLLGQRSEAASERMQTGGPHDALMQRLKSRPVRTEADSHKYFLNKYRRPGGSTTASDVKMNDIICRTAAKVDELRDYTERLSVEDQELANRLEALMQKQIHRDTDEALMHMSVFERQQVRIAEDKKEEILRGQRDEVKGAYVRVHRRVQSDLAEMRDYNVFLQDIRAVRLEKLQESLSTEGDGRRLRALVREMIRHGAQRVLQRLEQAAKWLEPWMREVLANSCHIEIRIEDGEGKLAGLRQRALGPVSKDLQDLSQQTKQERLDALQQDIQHFTSPAVHLAACLSRVSSPPATSPAGDDRSRVSSPARERPATTPALPPTAKPPPEGWRSNPKSRLEDDASSRIKAAESELTSLRRLLQDMRHNAGAAVCFRVREAERASGKSKQAQEQAHTWGVMVLTVLVSEKFAQETLKAMQQATGGKKQLTQ